MVYPSGDYYEIFRIHGQLHDGSSRKIGVDSLEGLRCFVG